MVQKENGEVVKDEHGNPKTVEKYVKFTQEEIETNKRSRLRFKQILNKSIESYINEKIDSLNSNDKTKCITEHIKSLKSEIVDEYTKMIIESTAYLQYIAVRKVLDPINDNLNKIKKIYEIYR